MPSKCKVCGHEMFSGFYEPDACTDCAKWARAIEANSQSKDTFSLTLDELDAILRPSWIPVSVSEDGILYGHKFEVVPNGR